MPAPRGAGRGLSPQPGAGRCGLGLWSARLHVAGQLSRPSARYAVDVARKEGKASENLGRNTVVGRVLGQPQDSCPLHPLEEAEPVTRGPLL